MRIDSIPCLRSLFLIRNLALVLWQTSLAGCLVVCLFGSLVGCKDKLASGHYEGNLWHPVNQERVQESVKIEVSSLQKNAFLIDVKTLDGVSAFAASFYLLKTKQLKIYSNFLELDGVLADSVRRAEFKDPEFDGEAQCFRSRQDLPVENTLEFCFKRDRFFLEIYDQAHTSIFEMSANSFTVEPPFTLEDPLTLSLTEAVEIAFQRNFSSRIAYQQALQARFAAMAAYLNLVPHLTTNLIWNTAPNYITYIATLQGLVPFLLPSYWFQAKEASLDQEIRDLALVVMRANLVTTVEELTYSLKRDEAVVEALQGFLRETQSFQERLNRGDLSVESQRLLREVADFTAEALTSDLGDMGKLIRQDRFSLAQALGFHNIEAIQEVNIDQEVLTIDLAVPIDPHATAQLATERAFELRQLDDLRKIARLKKLQNYFIWLDPTGDPKQSLGLNTFPQQKQLKSQVLELEIEREETKTRIYQNTFKLALDYNESIQSFRDIQKDLDLIQFNFQEILSDAIQGHPVHLECLKTEAQKYSASLVARQMILANYRIARAKKDRFLLAGYYSQILPRLQKLPEFRQSRLGKFMRKS